MKDFLASHTTKSLIKRLVVRKIKTKVTVVISAENKLTIIKNFKEMCKILN